MLPLLLSILVVGKTDDDLMDSKLRFTMIIYGQTDNCKRILSGHNGEEIREKRERESFRSSRG